VKGTGVTGQHFGIVAEIVSAVKIGKVSLSLKPGRDNDNVPVGTTGDFNVLEVS
jgi:hypothetical protein